MIVIGFLDVIESENINLNESIMLRFLFSIGNLFILGKFGRIVINIGKGYCKCRGFR